MGEPKLASEIMYRLKGKQVLVDLTGRDENVILFSPPMCFTMENGRVFTKCLDEVLTSTSNRTPEPPSHQRISHAATSVIVANTLGVKTFPTRSGDRREKGQDGGHHGRGEL